MDVENANDAEKFAPDDADDAVSADAALVDDDDKDSLAID